MAWLERAKVVAVFCAALSVAADGGQGAPQTDWDKYKTRSFTPSEDQHLTDPALIGAIDLHAHCDPDSYPRQGDAFDVARLAKDRACAVWCSNHYTETAGLAFLVRKHGTQGVEVFGGLTLDTPVGGVNPQAVRYMVDVAGHYGRIVWMPTHDSEHEVTYLKESRPFVRVSRDWQLLPEVLEVLSLIAQNDLTLATGHVAAEEALAIMREAKKRGVQRIIVTHPLLGPQYTSMSIDQLRVATSLGGVVEFVGRNFTGTAAETAGVIDVIRRIGPDSVFISSDSGLTGSPNHTDALAHAAKVLREAGFARPRSRGCSAKSARLINLPVL